MDFIQGFDRNQLQKMICYNLRRLMSIFSTKDLKNRLKTIALHYFNTIKAFLSFLGDKLFLKNRTLVPKNLNLITL